MNLTSPDGTKNQDQLVLVPDGGLNLMMLAASVSGLAALRRRVC